MNFVTGYRMLIVLVTDDIRLEVFATRNKHLAKPNMLICRVIKDVMANTPIKFLLLCTCILLPPTTNGNQCSQNLQNVKNIAVYEGQLNTMMNLSANPQDTMWTIKPTNDEYETYTITYYDGTIDPSLAGLFDINQTGLIVKNATTTENNDKGDPISTAGLYIGQCANNPNKTGAKLLVVRSGPQCSCSPINSNTSVNLSCSVSYADGTIHPIPAVMTWIVNGAYHSTEIPTRNETDGYVFVATSTITVDSSVVSNYQCILTFDAPTGIRYNYIAVNAPKFNESCSTPVCGSQSTTTAVLTAAMTTTSIAPCSAPLKNTAVYEGELNTLLYFPADPNNVKWTVTPTTKELYEYVITNFDGTVDPSMAGDYAIGPSGLTVLNATTTAEDPHPLSTAGLYKVECAGETVVRSVKLLVVHEGPTCTCTQGNSSTSVDLSCGVIYADSTFSPIPPVFTWYRDGIFYANYTPDVRTTSADSLYVTEKSTITVDDSTTSTYTCVQTFGQPKDIQENIATNAPEYSRNCIPLGC